MKILKKEWFIWKFWKRGGSREKGEEEAKSMPHAPVVYASYYSQSICFEIISWPPSSWQKSWLSAGPIHRISPNSAIFQAYHGENKLIFSEIMMRSALCYTNTMSWIFIVLTHWNNSVWIDMSPHSDTLSWFWDKPVFALSKKCFVLSGEATNTN